MENPEFPSNSNVSKNINIEERDIQRVTSGPATRRKKSLGKKFKEVFIAGDAKAAVSYALVDILLPMARDTIVEAAQAGIEKLILGDYRRYRGINRPPSGPTGVVNYQRYSTQMGTNSGWTPLSSPQRVLSRRARSQHDFDEVLLDSRSEAEQVIDQLFEVLSRYDTVTVANLYELVGLASNHTDHKWGWTDLRGAGVSRTHDGYLLDLPDPIPL
jgi:hypothetical protein